MSSELPILNAEQYVGVADIREAGKPEKADKTEKVKKGPKGRSEDGPRKRAKTSSTAVVTEVAEDDDDEDEDDADQDTKSKRARGRPRLDTQDQNAADRRRTQIRLAQRAYRSRKENAIQTLEKEVQVLQETKEEMSNAFMKLHDYAVSHGILEKIPAFAKELHSTTEKFLMLAERPSESSGRDSPAASAGRASRASDKSPARQSTKPSPPEAVKAQPTTTTNAVWGYTFDTEARIDTTLPMALVSLPPIAEPTITQAPLGYETITVPTSDNASFPFSPSGLDSFFDPGALPSVQQSVTPNITPPAFSPSTSASLPMPITMAYAEGTFGRRLQRSTLEFAYRLSAMPGPPQDVFAKAFGFCLLFEPIEKIRARLLKSLERTREESLNNWRTPFWALGGAGQHQFVGQHQAQQHQHQQQQAKPLGNQGTTDVAKHALGTNFGLGPFDEKITDVRDRQLDASMRIMLPGFQGEFFDPEEVELYLQSRGVTIPPGQDYVTAEVDVAWFDGQEPQLLQTNEASDQWAAQLTPQASKTPETTTMAAVDGSWMDEDVFGPTQAATSLLDFAESGESSMASRKRIVTVNVNTFIRELMHNGVCLGRTPAFRPKDVNQAFWTATRDDGLMGF